MPRFDGRQMQRITQRAFHLRMSQFVRSRGPSAAFREADKYPSPGSPMYPFEQRVAAFLRARGIAVRPLR